jgi:hypothetical protein
MPTWDEDVHFITFNAATAITSPNVADIDSATTVPAGQAHATSIFTANSQTRLIGIVCKAAAVAGTVVISDSASTTLHTFEITTAQETKIQMLPRGGMKLPKGGFRVTTTGANTILLFFAFSLQS